MGGHPSAPIVPALFALGEILDCTGRDFIAAYVAGFETETRIGRGVNLHHYEKGWHPTATLGVFGAAAACCHLMGLDRAKTAQALAIAASLASGIKANFGTMTKPLHVGHTARERAFRGNARARGVHRQRRRARTQAGLSARVQRRRQFRRGGDPRRLGAALRHRLPRCRHQATPVLRQHAPGGRCDAGAARPSTTSCRTRWRASIRGPIRAVSPIPTGPTRNRVSTRSSACNTAWRAPCSTAASCSNISRARRSATRPRAR